MDIPRTADTTGRIGRKQTHLRLLDEHYAPADICEGVSLLKDMSQRALGAAHEHIR